MGCARLSRGRSTRHWISQFLLIYALAYPFLALAEGNDLPRSPTFGVPGPTTILTIGLLLTAESLPITLTVIPILWAFIGGSAAFLLSVRTDLMLLAAGGGFLTYVIASRKKAGEETEGVKQRQRLGIETCRQEIISECSILDPD